jgi:hypothetical protein
MGEENEDKQIDDLQADLAAAWDEVEEVEADGDDNSVEAVQSDPEVSAAEPTDTEGVSSDQATPEPKVHDERAPVGLSPEAKEAWKDAPEALKKDIEKRERDFAAGIQQYAEGAKRAHEIQQTLAPYGQYIQMNGGPAQTINTLLQAGSQLQFGSAPQKAQMIASLIEQFGVDIQTLDNLLVGKDVPRETQQQTEIEQMLNQRLQPLQQQLGVYRQREQQMHMAQQGQIQTELQKFANDPKNEFYQDVKMDMADILDFAARRGQEMSMAEAYSRACNLRDDIRSIIEARKSKESAESRQAASVSISGSPGGPGAAPEHNDIRSALEHAWDTAGRV